MAIPSSSSILKSLVNGHKVHGFIRFRKVTFDISRGPDPPGQLRVCPLLFMSRSLLRYIGQMPHDSFDNCSGIIFEIFVIKYNSFSNKKMIFFTDIPLIEQFNVSEMGNPFAYIAWFENKIYVLYFDSKTVRVFTDQALFDELLEATQIPEIGRPMSMIISAFSRSIFISDEFGYISKIQINNRGVARGAKNPRYASD